MLVAIRKDSKNVQAVILAQSMLLAANYPVNVDGDFGSKTEQIVFLFQADNHLVSDGIIGSKTWEVLFAKSSHYLSHSAEKFLSEQDLVNAAVRLGIEVAAVKAVNEVESRGQGFLGNFPIILFERHVFWRRLKKYNINPASVVSGNSDFLSQDTGGYKGGLKEVKRLERAMKIHPQAAMESASWGLFQIMGYHWKSMGYLSINDFVERMKQNENEQLKAFVAFLLKVGKCHRSLKLSNNHQKLTSRNFAQFARCYNGSAYKRNAYHSKMLKAYLRYKTQADTEIEQPRAA
jgi:hypothetical protein